MADYFTAYTKIWLIAPAGTDYTEESTKSPHQSCQTGKDQAKHSLSIMRVHPFTYVIISIYLTQVAGPVQV